jgi:transposase
MQPIPEFLMASKDSYRPDRIVTPRMRRHGNGRIFPSTKCHKGRCLAIRKGPHLFSPNLYRARNLVERFFNPIKHCQQVKIASREGSRSTASSRVTLPALLLAIA